MMLIRTVKHLMIPVLLIVLIIPLFAVSASANESQSPPVLECYDMDINSVFQECDNIADALKKAEFVESYQVIVNDGDFSYLRNSDGKMIAHIYDIDYGALMFFESGRIVELLSEYAGEAVTIDKTYYLNGTPSYATASSVLYYQTSVGDFVYCADDELLFPVRHYVAHRQAVATIPARYINYLSYYWIDSELFNMAAKPAEQEFTVTGTAYIVLLALLVIAGVVAILILIHKKKSKDLEYGPTPFYLHIPDPFGPSDRTYSNFLTDN